MYPRIACMYVWIFEIVFQYVKWLITLMQGQWWNVKHYRQEEHCRNCIEKACHAFYSAVETSLQICVARMTLLLIEYRHKDVIDNEHNLKMLSDFCLPKTISDSLTILILAHRNIGCEDRNENLCAIQINVHRISQYRHTRNIPNNKTNNRISIACARHKTTWAFICFYSRDNQGHCDWE